MLTNLLERDTKELSSITESLNCLREYLNHHERLLVEIWTFKVLLVWSQKVRDMLTGIGRKFNGIVPCSYV